MTEYRHPMRKAVFHAYIREDGKEAIARAETAKLCPLIFIGKDAKDALQKAEDFRAKAVSENESAYIARKEAAELRKAKKDAAQ